MRKGLMLAAAFITATAAAACAPPITRGKLSAFSCDDNIARILGHNVKAKTELRSKDGSCGRAEDSIKDAEYTAKETAAMCASDPESLDHIRGITADLRAEMKAKCGTGK